MILEWFIGFHYGAFRNYQGKIYPQGWFGHVEIWGYTEDDTWLFLDPQASGPIIIVEHRYDDVMDQLNARHTICDVIFRLPNERKALFPLHFPMNCATVVGQIVGLRAFTPRGLRRKLLAIGAEVIHENAQRGSSGQGSAAEGAAHL